MMTLHDAISRAAQDAGLKPVKFDKPLKSVGCLVKFRKAHTPEHLSDRHAIIGWGLGVLIDQFSKDLYNVRSLNLSSEEETVIVKAVVHITGLTFEEDHEAWLQGLIDSFVGKETKQFGSYWRPRYYTWDSAEIISNIVVYSRQMDGSGK